MEKQIKKYCYNNSKAESKGKNLKAKTKNYQKKPKG